MREAARLDARDLTRHSPPRCIDGGRDFHDGEVRLFACTRTDDVDLERSEFSLDQLQKIESKCRRLRLTRFNGEGVTKNDIVHIEKNRQKWFGSIELIVLRSRAQRVYRGVQGFHAISQGKKQISCLVAPWSGRE